MPSLFALDQDVLDTACDDIARLRQRITKLEAALRGIASCATQCPGCQMLRQVAEEALK